MHSFTQSECNISDSLCVKEYALTHVYTRRRGETADHVCLQRNLLIHSTAILHLSDVGSFKIMKYLWKWLFTDCDVFGLRVMCFIHLFGTLTNDEYSMGFLYRVKVRIHI